MSNNKKTWKIEKPVEFLYDDDYYLVNGKRYLRVTRIKSVINQPSLNAWRGNVGNKKANIVMKESAKKGKNFHKLVEQILKGFDVNIDNYDDEMTNILSLFKTMVKKHNIVAEETEQNLLDDELMIGGTTDFIGYMNLDELGKNVHVIADWKTSSGIYDEYWIQIAAYIKMFEKNTGIKLDGAVIFQFKNGEVNKEEKTYDELSEYYNAFINCYYLYKFLNRR